MSANRIRGARRGARRACPLLALCAVVAVASMAAGDAPRPPLVFELDPAATEIRFTLEASLHAVEGRFTLKRGELRFDPASGRAEGEIVVDAASGQSGNRLRDAAMRDDVLEAARYPEIRFRPERVEGDLGAAGDVRARVHGRMDLHGSEHEMTFEVTARRTNDRVNLRTRFSVPYVAWGLEDPSLLFLRVAGQVGIEVNASARLRAGEAVAAPPARKERE